MTPHLLAIDQGTTSTRAILFDGRGKPVASHALTLRQIFPANGWVEHDADEIWQATEAVTRAVLRGRPAVAAIGLTNQRETSVIWDRATGAPLHNAIVWQDRRTASLRRAESQGLQDARIAAKTGLLLDPYFSATKKLEWLLNHAGAREHRPGKVEAGFPSGRATQNIKKRAALGEILFGTIDSWLIWKLTGGVHATDVKAMPRATSCCSISKRWTGIRNYAEIVWCAAGHAAGGARQ